MIRSPRQLVAGRSRLLASGSDAAISSLGNFAFNGYAAYRLSLHEYGVFSIVFLVALVIVGVGRSLCSDPLVISSSSEPESTRREETRLSIGACLYLAAAVGLGSFIAIMAWDPAQTKLALALAFGLPVLLLQDNLRWAAYCDDKPWRAAGNNAAWTVASFVGIGVTLVAGVQLDSTGAFAIWALSALAGIVFALAVQRNLPSLNARTDIQWLRRRSSLGLPILGDYSLLQLQTQLSNVSLGAVIGASQFGIIRQAMVPLALANILTTGSISFLQATFARNKQAGLDEALPLVRKASIALGASAAAVGLLAFVVPESWGALALGSDWGTSRAYVPALTLSLIGGAAASSYGIALRVFGHAPAVLGLRLAVAPASFAIVILGGWLGGLTGACTALAVTGLGYLTSMAWLMRATRRKSRATTASSTQAEVVSG